MPVLYYINCEQNYYTEKHSRCYPNIKNFNSVNRKKEDKKKTKTLNTQEQKEIIIKNESE